MMSQRFTKVSLSGVFVPQSMLLRIIAVQAPFSACLKNEREIQIDKLRGMKPAIYDTINGEKTIVEKLVQRRLRHVEQERLSLLDSEQRWRFELTTNRGESSFTVGSQSLSDI
jgi:hypothetical protein